MRLGPCFLVIFCAGLAAGHAAVSMEIEKVTPGAAKTVVKIKVQNNYSQAVRAARAQVFLLGSQGVVVGSEVRWIIGPGSGQPPLPSQHFAFHHFVVPTKGPVTDVRVRINRVVLDDGRVCTE